ncbi:Transcriptional regulatory protein SrrA [Gimesia panareensis]|uniref:Transcriptional regulatory protein SrrA n=1 Tax=Gimesia panareensis TaxID=2527978 RepID=A0A517Q5Z7_9PLAN|nr:response regulator transcription factor [Gimesia panareensis]QDT27067.1 Transcriptional regulatory protein SrrA [Gimesia panareensis]
MLQASEKSNARILVIDDDPLFRNLMVSFLRREYFVSVASDGSEGFYKALEYPPDIAIVDVQMPVWDGLQTLKAFRSHPTLCNTKIIMLTSDASKGTVIAAIQGGANDYIIKTSFSKTELLDKVRKFAQPGGGNVANTPNSSRRQNSVTATNTVSQQMEPVKTCPESASIEDQLGDLSLDKSEEEMLEEIMDEWE